MNFFIYTKRKLLLFPVTFPLILETKPFVYNTTASFLPFFANFIGVTKRVKAMPVAT